MPNVHQANAFMNSFTRGFSFVDDMNSRKRQEAKLDERLKLEAADRDFRRKRLEQIDVERGEDRAIAAEDRERVEVEREKGRAGDRAALNPNATDDELRENAPFSAAAFEALAKRIGRAEALKALQTVRGQAGTQTGGLNAQATGADGPIGEPAPAGTTGESLIGESRGRDSLQSIDLDDISEFDSEAPQGLGGQALENLEGAGNRVTGALRGLSTGAANLVQGVAGGPPVDTGANFSDAVGGNISVSSGFTTEEQFASMTDPKEFETARLKNEEILTGLKEQGRANLNEVPDDISRLDALRAGSRAQRAEAQRQEFVVTQTYEGMTDPTQENAFRSLVAEDPMAGSVQYAKDRATLQSANPQLAAQIDMQMQPAFKAAEQRTIETMVDHPMGSIEHRKSVRDLQSLRVTQSQIYADYSPSAASGVDARGMPIGNSQLSGEVMRAVEDPDRPRNPQPFAGRQVSTANTQVSRMAGNRRATDAQLKAAIVMKDAGLASAQDVLTLTMTGSWPNTSPAAQFKQFRPGEAVYTVGANGEIQYAFTPPAKSGTGKKTSAADLNQVTTAIISQFEDGFMTMFPPGTDGSQEALEEAKRQLILDVDQVQETYNLRDPIAGMRLGQTYAAAVALASAEDNFLPSWLGDEQPTFQEILRSPKLAARLAAEHDIPLNLEAVPRMDGVAVNNLREELMTPNKWPMDLQQAAQNMTDEDLIRTVARYDLITAGPQFGATQGE